MKFLDTAAFVSPIALSFRKTSLTSSATSSSPLRVAPSRRSACPDVVPRMQQTSTSRKDKEKKRATPTFGTDIKGNTVWTLRAATADDVDAVFPMVEHVLTRDLVESFVTSSPCCTVCEATVKGTKEGEGYLSVIMGVVLVDITLGARDKKEGFEAGSAKYGDLVTIAGNSDFPDADVAKKLLLGSLKLMKDDGVVEVIHCNDNAKRIQLLKENLFKEVGSSELGFPKFRCKLAVENPDPMKKIM